MYIVVTVAGYILAKDTMVIIMYVVILYVPYPRERGPMGSAPYIGPRLGGGPILEVSVSHLYAKERPGKLPTLAA